METSELREVWHTRVCTQHRRRQLGVYHWPRPSSTDPVITTNEFGHTAGDPRRNPVTRCTSLRARSLQKPCRQCFLAGGWRALPPVSEYRGQTIK